MRQIGTKIWKTKKLSKKRISKNLLLKEIRNRKDELLPEKPKRGKEVANYYNKKKY